MAVQIMKPGSEPKPSKKGDYIVIFFIVCAFIVSIVFGIKGLTEYKDIADMQFTWKKIQTLALGDEEETSQEETPQEETYVQETTDGTKTEISVTKTEDLLFQHVNLKALTDINADVNGYIVVPNTKISYPILKENKTGEYFYMRHNMNKEYDVYGSIFELSDAERGLSELDNPITWIFGHHMSSGDMFTGLYAYKEESFKDNPIYVYREDMRVEYMVVAAIETNKYDKLYKFNVYERNSDEYAEVIKYAISKSMYDTGRTLTNKDDMLILSTCNGSAGTSQRFILVCKKVRTAVIQDKYTTTEHGD